MKRFLFILPLIFTSCMLNDPVKGYTSRFHLSDGIRMVWEGDYRYFINGTLIEHKQSEIIMEHTGYKNVRGFRCFEFRLTEKIGANVYTGYEYLADTDTGLILVDQTGLSGSVIWGGKSREIHDPHLKNGSFFPMLILSYPLYPGKEWIIFEDPFFFSIRKRKVVGTDEITTSAGTFTTWILETWDSLIGPSKQYNTFIIHDYITTDLWVKKEIEYETTLGFDTYRVVISYTLKNYGWIENE